MLPSRRAPLCCQRRKEKADAAAMRAAMPAAPMMPPRCCARAPVDAQAPCALRSSAACSAAPPQRTKICAASALRALRACRCRASAAPRRCLMIRAYGVTLLQATGYAYTAAMLPCRRRREDCHALPQAWRAAAVRRHKQQCHDGAAAYANGGASSQPYSAASKPRGVRRASQYHYSRARGARRDADAACRSAARRAIKMRAFISFERSLFRPPDARSAFTPADVRRLHSSHYSAAFDFVIASAPQRAAAERAFAALMAFLLLRADGASTIAVY